MAFIKKSIHLDAGAQRASVEDSRRVVEICTQYAQQGMLTIFLAVFFITLSLAFVEPFLFIGYLVSIAIFGLYQAIYMANAGGAWDNAKKVVEVDLHMKGTALHDASIVGDTVGDPFKDTSSVALNPIIKFTTLFGLLAVELAVSLSAQGMRAAAEIQSPRRTSVHKFGPGAHVPQKQLHIPVHGLRVVRRRMECAVGAFAHAKGYMNVQEHQAGPVRARSSDA